MVGVNLRGRRCPDPVHRLVLKPIQRLVAHLAHGMLERDTISEQNKEEQGEEGLGQKSRRHHDGAGGITCKLNVRVWRKSSLSSEFTRNS